MTNEAKRNEDTIESLVRHFLDSQLVSSICWDFPEQSGWPDVKRVLEQGFRAGIAAERERGSRLSAEPPQADGSAAHLVRCQQCLRIYSKPDNLDCPECGSVTCDDLLNVGR